MTTLAGATSCRLDAVEVESESGVSKLVLRRFTDSAWVRREPDIAAREGASLAHAARAGVAAPRLLALDRDGAHCGVPATLSTMLAGRVILRPEDLTTWIRELARAAAGIHRVDAAGFRWKYQRYNQGERLVVPAWSKEQDAWRRAIETVQSPPRPFAEVFIHRDYHPANVLWSEGQITGVVDWVNGCRGPAGIDVAWCRHNLANLHDVATADAFLEAYVDAAGPAFQYDPYWDLMTVVELLPGPPRMYEGWRAHGVNDITNGAMRERVDRYISSLVARL